jgi:hypothetical protein
MLRAIPIWDLSRRCIRLRKWTRWEDWVAVVAGIVAALSTIWVTPMGSSVVLMLVFGILLIAAGVVNLAMPELDWMEWVQGVLGVLLFISPWMGRYATDMGAAWLSWICGGVAIVVTAIALMPRLTSHSHGGGVAHAH